MTRKKLDLDLIDRKIISELDINSRQSLSKIAKKARSSPTVVKYRLKRMEKAGFIKHYNTLLDAGKLGLMVWNVYMKLHNSTNKEENMILEHLCKTRAIWWVAGCSGRWDIIYSACVKDVKELYGIVNGVHNIFSKYILEQSLAAHAEVEIISRGYLTDAPGKGVTWYKRLDKQELDHNDLRILKTINRNSRMPSTEIARKTGLTPRIVYYRIKDLTKRGIISRFRLQLDVSKIGMSFYKVIVYVKEYTDQKNTRLKNYCIGQGNIIHYEQKVGPWMLELEMDAKGYEEAEKQMRQMKENFPDFVSDYELVLIKEEFKGELDLTKYIDN